MPSSPQEASLFNMQKYLDITWLELDFKVSDLIDSS